MLFLIVSIFQVLKLLSIRLLVGHDDALGCEEDDAYVEPERPVLQVPDVASHAFLHLPKFLGLATIACHLCPSCDAWFGEVAHHVLVDDGAVYLGVVQHVWSWTHDTHVASQHIEELRKLVDVGLPHEVAKGKLAWVVLRSLCQVGILVDVHRAEFNALEGLAVDARSVLTEEDGAGAL